MNRRILRLAIPNIVSNLTVPLLSSVDTALMGHMKNPAQLGAIAVGSMIFNFLYWGFGFLRMGTTGLTAQAFGRKDNREIIAILGRGVVMAISVAIVLFLLQRPILWLSFLLVDSSREVETMAKVYFNIRIFAAPATLSLYAFHGWFLGMQNARFPMFLAVFGNLVNLGANLLFIYGFGMKSEGVAMGTVVAQYFSLFLAIGLFFFSYQKFIAFLKQSTVFAMKSIKEFFSVNVDIFIRTLCLIFAFSFFTSASAARGDIVLAGNSILLQLTMILAYGVDGFAFAAESLVGNYIGEKDLRNMVKSIRYSFFWGLGIAFFISLVYGLLQTPILHLFTDQKEILKFARQFMPWVIAAPLFNAVAFIWDGVFIGATSTKAMRNALIISAFLVFVPAYYLFRGWIGNNALWLAMTLFMISRGVILSWYSKKALLRAFRKG